MGGEVAQVLALDMPSLVRRLILAGTGPSGGEGMSQQRPPTAELFARQYGLQGLMWLPILFSPSRPSQKAGRRWLARVRERADRDAPRPAQTARAHRAATATPTCRRSPSPPSSSTVATTSFLATANSFIPQQNLPDAQLILYPDSGQIRPFIPQEKTMTRPAVSHAPGGHHPRQRPGYPIPAALVSPGPRTQDRQEPPAPGSHHQPDRGRDQPVARPRRHPPTRLRTRRPAPVDHVKDPDRTG